MEKVLGLHGAARVSKQEREEHERMHMLIRAWCPCCLKVARRNGVHKKKKDECEQVENKVPRIATDYFFMLEEDSTANTNPILVMVDENCGDRYASSTGQKGVGSNREMDWFASKRKREKERETDGETREKWRRATRETRTKKTRSM